VREAIRRDLLASSHDCSEGGLAVALAESSIASDYGVEVTLSTGQSRLDRVLFAEGGHRIIVSVKADRQTEWNQLLSSVTDLNVTHIGSVSEQKRLIIQSATAVHLDLDLNVCQSTFRDALPRRIDSD
jgi:phosphoribosylformylglycinamidine synthase